MMCGIYTVTVPQKHINCSCSKGVNLMAHTIRITKETHLDHILVPVCLAYCRFSMDSS